MNEFVEIDLKELLAALFHRLWLILLCALVTGLAAYIYTANFITPLYRASVTLYVNNLSARAAQDVEYVSAGNLATSQQLVNTYVNIIKSRTVLEKVVEKMELKVSADTIRGMMTAQSVGETEIFEIYISHPKPDMAAKIANAIAEVAPSEIANIVEGSSAKVIDYAVEPQSRYTPSFRENTFLGCCVGAGLAVAAIVLSTMLDTRIKSESELEQLFNLPILGTIPAFDTRHKGRRQEGQYGHANGYGIRTAGEK